MKALYLVATAQYLDGVRFFICADSMFDNQPEAMACADTLNNVMPQAEEPWIAFDVQVWLDTLAKASVVM